MRREGDAVAAGELVELDIRALGFLVDGELQLSVRLGGGADGEESQAFLHLPLMRAGDAGGRIDRGAGADMKLVAFDVADDGVAGEPIKLVIASGGNAKSGTFYIWTG